MMIIQLEFFRVNVLAVVQDLSHTGAVREVTHEDLGLLRIDEVLKCELAQHCVSQLRNESAHAGLDPTVVLAE